MPNANYRKGVRFERERQHHYESLGMDASRTAGSHGTWDVIATDFSRGLVYHVQCKVVGSLSTAQRKLRAFQSAPPFPARAGCYQVLEVKVKGSKEVLSVTI